MTGITQVCSICYTKLEINHHHHDWCLCHQVTHPKDPHRQDPHHHDHDPHDPFDDDDCQALIWDLSKGGGEDPTLAYTSGGEINQIR